MMRVRIAGPTAVLDRTLAVLQDLAVLHVDRPRVFDRTAPARTVVREQRHVERPGAKNGA